LTCCINAGTPKSPQPYVATLATKSSFDSTNAGGSAITPNPLSVSIEYQGDGRFDDPQRERTILYGSDAVEPCIIEIAMPWYLHSDASYVQRMEAPERDIDSELLQAEFDDAERDRAIARGYRKSRHEWANMG
jgi:hypothetical protein